MSPGGLLVVYCFGGLALALACAVQSRPQDRRDVLWLAAFAVLCVLAVGGLGLVTVMANGGFA